VYGPKSFWALFDLRVQRFLQVILALGIVAAVVVVSLLVIRGVPRALVSIDSVDDLQRSVQALFAGVLLVLLGLELMDTLRHYFIEHHLRAEFLISVALIAVARHVIQIDYEHVSAAFIAALAFLLLTLGVAYVGMRRWSAAQPPSGRQPNPSQ
jgi:uncharacterized membrane protein (DUF373 family)